MENNIKKHPFTTTLGPGPYKYVGFGEIMFSETFGAKYVGPGMDTGCGTCTHCGHAIVNIYIVQTAEGKRCGVGSDCIRKVNAEGDFTNMTDFERELKAQKRKAGRERRERQRLALKEKVIKLVKENEQALRAIPFVRVQTRTAWDYCAWYIKQNRTLGAYKMFQNKLIEWGVK
jgi:hypothetical protein